MNAASYKSWTPIGYARYATLSSAVTLDDAPTAGGACTSFTVNGIQVYPQHAVISIEATSVRVRYDGTAPTSTEGELFAVGTKITIEDSPNMIKNFSVIQTAAGSAITVHYFI